MKPVAWMMVRNGEFFDAIHPDEHARHEGDYTVPLYTAPNLDVATVRDVDGKIIAVTLIDDEHSVKDVLWQSLRELSDGCGNCHACLVGVMENNIPVTSQRMIVCSDCGNKRCPKASNHRHKCTGSNEVGQYGSIYTAPRELSNKEIEDLADKYLSVNYKYGEDIYVLGEVEFARAILKKASEK